MAVPAAGLGLGILGTIGGFLGGAGEAVKGIGLGAGNAMHGIGRGLGEGAQAPPGIEVPVNFGTKKKPDIRVIKVNAAQVGLLGVAGALAYGLYCGVQHGFPGMILNGCKSHDEHHPAAAPPLALPPSIFPPVPPLPPIAPPQVGPPPATSGPIGIPNQQPIANPNAPPLTLPPLAAPQLHYREFALPESNIGAGDRLPTPQPVATPWTLPTSSPAPVPWSPTLQPSDLLPFAPLTLPLVPRPGQPLVTPVLNPRTTKPPTPLPLGPLAPAFPGMPPIAPLLELREGFIGLPAGGGTPMSPASPPRLEYREFSLPAGDAVGSRPAIAARLVRDLLPNTPTTSHPLFADPLPLSPLRPDLAGALRAALSAQPAPASTEQGTLQLLQQSSAQAASGQRYWGDVGYDPFPFLSVDELTAVRNGTVTEAAFIAEAQRQYGTTRLGGGQVRDVIARAHPIARVKRDFPAYASIPDSGWVTYPTTWGQTIVANRGQGIIVAVDDAAGTTRFVQGGDHMEAQSIAQSRGVLEWYAAGGPRGQLEAFRARYP